MNRRIHRKVSLFGMGIVLASGMALATAGEPKVGDKAPDFKLQGSDGKTHALSDYKGKSGVVLAWFPKAFTGGCTKECKSFATASKSLHGLKIGYFTASVDTSELNKKFAESLDCDYPILSDPDKSVATAYGVVHEGRAVPERWTFYIDKEGVIKAIDKKVRPEQAAEDVAAKVKELGIAGE
jgi:thioredoxin-dependent peroxiredoxin